MVRFRLILVSIALAGALASPMVLAQQTTPGVRGFDLQQQLVHTEMRRRDRIAGNMHLSPEKARRFWPVYEDYRAAVVDVRRQQLELIVEYADVYNRNAVTAGKAQTLLGDALNLEAERDRLKRAYIRNVGSVLDPTRQLRLYQVETRLDAEAQAGVLAQIPLAQ